MTAPLLVLVGAALWGTTGTAQALGPEASDPAEVGALRILVGAALVAAGLVVVSLPRRRVTVAGRVRRLRGR